MEKNPNEIVTESLAKRSQLADEIADDIAKLATKFKAFEDVSEQAQRASRSLGRAVKDKLIQYLNPVDHRRRLFFEMISAGIKFQSDLQQHKEPAGNLKLSEFVEERNQRAITALGDSK